MKGKKIGTTKARKHENGSGKGEERTGEDGNHEGTKARKGEGREKGIGEDGNHEGTKARKGKEGEGRGSEKWSDY